MINTQPYTNFHELNLDWILSEIKRLSEMTSGELTANVEKIVFEMFNSLMPKASYNPETETIIFELERKRG